MAGLRRQGHRKDRAAGHLPLHLPKHRSHILLVQHLRSKKVNKSSGLRHAKDTSLRATCADTRMGSSCQACAM